MHHVRRRHLTPSLAALAAQVYKVQRQGKFALEEAREGEVVPEYKYQVRSNPPRTSVRMHACIHAARTGGCHMRQVALEEIDEILGVYSHTFSRLLTPSHAFSHLFTPSHAFLRRYPDRAMHGYAQASATTVASGGTGDAAALRICTVEAVALLLQVWRAQP